MSLKKLQTAATRNKDGCIEALRQAIDAEPDAVCVFYRKDGAIHYRSVFYNRLEVIGALEAAKQEIWSALP